LKQNNLDKRIAAQLDSKCLPFHPDIHFPVFKNTQLISSPKSDYCISLHLECVVLSSVLCSYIAPYLGSAIFPS